VLATAVLVVANPRPARAAASELVSTFSLVANSFALDPVRSRLYATVAPTSRAAVIDAITLRLIDNVFVDPGADSEPPDAPRGDREPRAAGHGRRPRAAHAFA
jgi:hypothetical protein